MGMLKIGKATPRNSRAEALQDGLRLGSTV
jgi:hypothetical protein